jgi:hypothetical protein
VSGIGVTVSSAGASYIRYHKTGKTVRLKIYLDLTLNIAGGTAIQVNLSSIIGVAAAQHRGLAEYNLSTASVIRTYMNPASGTIVFTPLAAGGTWSSTAFTGWLEATIEVQ